ncbi:germination lipoprotein GerS-related protein [uncultured Clostridium sp.]|uniref:germination lipoprotein GerS-related protein n=1 Tax=uncultured Clostridium sp. TaxID=59620 RepID=UPI002630FB87|nr:germination lipoprotein GerS-related protein [uncultured Clostridium sp.]
MKLNNKKIKDEKVKKSLKRNIKLGAIIILPIIIIGLIIMLRHNVTLTNDEIIQRVKNLDRYNTIVEFTINNSRGEYVEKVNLHYSKGHAPMMEFGDKLVKTYNKDSISMKYKDGKEYNLEKDTDSFYILAILEELFKNPITSIEEGSEEWGDIKYLKVSIDIVSNNQHLDKAVIYINKTEKIPMLMKIQDINNKDRVKIEYRDFSKIDKCK